ncbi:MAG: ribonuclease III [Actinomycetaceae bacterium]|nr:ribonuclease III [Actinomycetaceae bacterium]
MSDKKHIDPGAACSDVDTLVKAWGIDIDPEMLVLALTHRSFSHEMGYVPHNERLEFLGDAILQLIVTEKLYRRYPDHSEGHLAKMRAATVSQPALASVGRDLDLGNYILLGRGEHLTGGKNKDSILCDTVEALIGATYLCHGLEPTRSVVERLLANLLDNVLTRGAGIDWKTSLQEIAAQLHLSPLTYEVTGVGPDHARQFHAKATVAGKIWGQGTGTSKKNAEREAAHQAVLALQEEYKTTANTAQLNADIVCKNTSD